MDDIGFTDVKARKTNALIAFITEQLTVPKSILVVGCGSGLEAGDLARAFDAETTGIDIGQSFEFDHAASRPAVLKSMDARELDFASQSFDLIYSFHALEHIPGPERALAEMSRVLRPTGSFVIGTPNRSRIFGYIGSAHPLRSKIAWNYADWQMRLRGKWTNEAGAHAGFSAPELLRLTKTAFGRSRDISTNYYGLLYPRHLSKMNLLDKSGLKSIVYPCVYVAG